MSGRIGTGHRAAWMPTAAQGNAASRLEAFIVTSSAYAYGGDPDIEEIRLKER